LTNDYACDNLLITDVVIEGAMQISNAEWQVMRVVWEQGSVGAAEVIESLLATTHWSHRTVRSLLNRLVKKGALEARRVGGRNIYRAKLAQSRCVRREGQSFLNKVFDGDAGALLVHFIESQHIAPDELKKLKALLGAKQKK
jgi:BlaI family transcriptional regulator, penicillinase repressor